MTPETLAREACEIEIDILGKPIGKQDQYIAAFGGLRLIEFRPDDSVTVSTVPMSDEKKRRFGESLLLFYTGITRKADNILSKQKENIESRLPTLDLMKAQAQEIHEALTNCNMNRVGRVLDTGWKHKREAGGAHLQPRDRRAVREGAGRGRDGRQDRGRGRRRFPPFVLPPDRQGAVRHALAEMKEAPFALERDGTKVIFNARR